VNIATLHYYFDSKEALIRAVVDYLLHQFLTITAPAPNEGEATELQQLRQVFADLRYQLQQEPQLFIVMNELHLRAQRDPAVRAILKRLNDGWQAHIEAICEEGLRNRVFRADLDPHRATSEVIALIKGISLQSVSALDTFDVERIGADIEHWFINPDVKTRKT
jgi:AcrR family transcriptional regulator